MYALGTPALQRGSQPDGSIPGRNRYRAAPQTNRGGREDSEEERRRPGGPAEGWAAAGAAPATGKRRWAGVWGRGPKPDNEECGRMK